MTMPAVQKTWLISANNRISYVSLNATMGAFLYGLKQYLKTQGYTVAGSCNGTTGAMDGVDRWASPANAQTRFGGTAGAQSWIVLTDGNGVQILFTYDGTADNLATFGFSPGALYVVAATPTFKPTATDEQLVLTSTDLINATTSSDRTWFCWVDNLHKSFRVIVARAGVFVGQLWGVELVASKVVSGVTTATWTPAVWGFGMPVNNDNITTVGQQWGLARPSTSGTPRNAICKATIENLGGNVVMGILCVANRNELQGATGIPVIPIGLCSTDTNTQGKLGDLYDWWMGRVSGGADGDLYDSRKYLAIAGIRGSGGNGLWPWDGTTVPQLY